MKPPAIQVRSEYNKVLLPEPWRERTPGSTMHHPSSLFLLAGTLLLLHQLPLAPAKHVWDICRLPPQRGNCMALFIRWYYNPRVGRCLVFVYGGCLGNANNFHSRSACEHRCSRPATVKPGTCPARVESDVRCGQLCFNDASCPGNERCCQTICGRECRLPSEAIHGYCPRTQHRLDRPCTTSCTTDLDCDFGLRIPRRKCCRYGCHQLCVKAEEEHPGVCPKRERVYTFAPCNDTCRDDRDCPLTQKCCFTGCSRGCLDSVRSDRCQLPSDPGPCYANMPRYYYDPSRKRCIRFIYGGCRGNSNRFKTKKACKKACGKISPEVCKLPSETGPCRAYSEFFYYNSTLSSCEKFVYGGCRGNDNRFYTKLECKMVCRTSANSTTTSD
ncbi:actinia tenebrosa protease inhibitors [Zootoca vivipara]|uniref:actinia tenebrosa protease inhibitors n=1 Tax=Zootoca vivipara TaxID=8524 RepID=UPI00293BADD3|nr:actinia tenebrosa protease inhibitors [Zootoca vivipara]